VPAAGYSGPDSFSYKANDAALGSNTATVSVTVIHVNHAPVAAAQSATTTEDTAKAITLTASDVDADVLTFSIVTAPAHGTLTGTGPGITYTPAANYNGPDSFTFKANDGALDSNVATVSITVTAVNDAPVAVGDSYTADEDTPLTIAAPGVLGNDTDVDSASLTAVLVAGPAHGTLTLNANGGLTYTPISNYNGSDSFTYKANDGALDSNVATVSVTIRAINDAPAFTRGADQTVAQDSGVKTVTGWATNISAGPSDESAQLLNFLVSSDNAAIFSAQPAIDPAGTLTFTPAAGANGVAHVTVQLHDNGGTANGGVDTSAAQTFTVTIQAPQGPVTLSIADASVVEGNSGTRPMVFTVTLSAASSSSVTVSYATLSGTASTKDYQTTSGTLTFAPGETTKTISVLVIGDGFKEANETFVVRLSNAVNATIARSDALGTIIDDDSGTLFGVPPLDH
jgi:VCBS repeat-containing protein